MVSYLIQEPDIIDFEITYALLCTSWGSLEAEFSKFWDFVLRPAFKISINIQGTVNRQVIYVNGGAEYPINL